MGSRSATIPTGSVPLIFVVGAISQYAGAAVGVFLFDTTEPFTVAWLRAAAAGIALLAWRRPWRLGLTRRDVLVASAFGLVTIAMNVAFYEALARIPLGTAVAVEFLGPVAVAALGSRRARDLLSAVMVGVAVALLAGIDLGQMGIEAAGFGFALASAALWAGYILLGKRVADSGDGLDSLAIGMAVGAVATAPLVIIPQTRIDASVFAEPRTWILGLAIGLLSTAVPYALDQVVLAVVGRARFALLLALLPATAAVVGATVLRQTPTAAELAGIALVIMALLIGAAPGTSSGRPPPA